MKTSKLKLSWRELLLHPTSTVASKTRNPCRPGTYFSAIRLFIQLGRRDARVISTQARLFDMCIRKHSAEPACAWELLNFRPINTEM